MILQLHADIFWLIPLAFSLFFMLWVLWNWWKEERKSDTIDEFDLPGQGVRGNETHPARGPGRAILH